MIKFKPLEVQKDLQSINNTLMTLANPKENHCDIEDLKYNQDLLYLFTKTIKDVNEKLSGLKEKEEQEKLLGEDVKIELPKMKQKHFMYCNIQFAAIMQMSFMVDTEGKIKWKL